MYRLMSNDIRIDTSKLFTVKDTITRGHHLKVHTGPTCKLDIRHKFFTQRVITPWNTLPDFVVSSTTVEFEQFKFNYDKWHGIIV